ncbi:unnamed protein product [Arabidopsis lyrata]|nr:unnamed protein product [Arabidopsis lyrata]
MSVKPGSIRRSAPVVMAVMIWTKLAAEDLSRWSFGDSIGAAFLSN